jgi:hypothetical protein
VDRDLPSLAVVCEGGSGAMLEIVAQAHFFCQRATEVAFHQSRFTVGSLENCRSTKTAVEKRRSLALTFPILQRCLTFPRDSRLVAYAFTSSV